MVYRFLHLSDIHFGQEKAGTLVKHDIVRSMLLRDAKEFADVRGAANRILVTGDTAYAGRSAEYAIASAWLEKLSEACGCGEDDVSTIPGNHDCDLDAISHQSKMLHAQLRNSSAELVQAHLHGINQDGEESNPFLPKLRAYREFANAYGCGFESPARPFWTRDFPLPGKVILRLIGLNSVQVSDLDDEEGRMVLGNQQYGFMEDDNVINVVLVHHPLNWFIDKVEASQMLQNNARVVMVGHEHTLNIQKSTDAMTRKEWLVLYSGATNPPETSGAYNFTYNWIEFSCRKDQGQQHLAIEVFPRVWVPQSARFVADTTRLGGPTSTIVEIACPHVRELSDPEPPASLSPPVSIGAAAAPADTAMPAVCQQQEAGSPDKGHSTNVNGASMADDDAAFDRLRYLFWRHLGWRQRLKVLVEIDALPKTADQPVPQTLERVALEDARASGKLHKLWEALMPLVPDDKREANPFTARDR